MAASLLNRLNFAFQRLELAIASFFGKFPPNGYCLAGINLDKISDVRGTSSKSVLEEIFGDGFLLAVPTSRRTIEKRLKRKFGVPGLVNKMIVPKTTLRTCNTCGDDHEVGVLCPTCYKKVIDETKAMQEAIQNELGLEPIEKEVIVLYQGEKDDKPKEFLNGKRIVELKKTRPSWFSKNLLQETTQQPADTNDVKPSQLG